MEYTASYDGTIHLYKWVQGVKWDTAATAVFFYFKYFILHELKWTRILKVFFWKPTDQQTDYKLVKEKRVRANKDGIILFK